MSPQPQSARPPRLAVLGALALLAGMARTHAGALASPAAPARTARDPRIRVVPYSADRIYRLRGYAGYQIDVQFALGERVIGVGVGDAKGVTLASSGDQLFLKPRAVPLATNLTVLTNRRTYLFDYTARSGPPAAAAGALTYVLRFEYPPAVLRTRAVSGQRARVARDLAAAEHDAPRNYDYWYRGAPSLKPRAAWDDGVQTHLVFGPRAELPAVFVRSADGSESLVNFAMRGGAMVIQRIAKRLILRRGKLSGCIVNRAYFAGGRRLASGTLSPDVWRLTRPAAAPRGTVGGKPVSAGAQQ